ncbi:HepT-like ribonuclease domain-containing protein [Metallibacterium sp.]|uniref:DUF86 domain-containing protein n=1 Tax=Metallibacterium sp. TaxID=2940281 RepID=UPI002604F564|nr:HepT-like ribonuclease domain-containing protein [Metallibacterium sp.]
MDCPRHKPWAKPSRVSPTRACSTPGVLDAGLAQRLRGAVGFRNVAVHSYRAIDWQIVHTIVHKHPDDFGSFALEAMRHAQ